MRESLDAVYENGVFRPLTLPVRVPDRSRVRISVERIVPARGELRSVVGILPDEDAAEMREIIEREFAQTDERDWR